MPARVATLSRTTSQNRARSSAGTPSAAMSSSTAESGSDWSRCAVSGFRSSTSNLVGAAPNWPMSNPSVSVARSVRSSTGCDEPSRAISDSSAIGSIPAARRSRSASVPSRFDNASPCGPVSSEWCAKAGWECPSAAMIWICVAVLVTWSEPRTTWVMPKSMSSTTEAIV